MRRLAGLAAASLLLLSAEPAVAASHPSTVHLTATGTITGLDLSRITVAGTTCSYGGRRLSETVQGFAIGENVRIGCVGASLRSIALVPVVVGRPHPDAIVVTVPTASQSPGPPSLTVANTASTSGTIGNIATVAGTQTSPALVEITINGETCSLPNTSGDVQWVQVGYSASMSCTSYTNGHSTGQLTVHGPDEIGGSLSWSFVILG